MRLSVRDHFQQRKLVRQLEDLADQIAERLRPVYEHEFRDVPDNERAAALLAVVDALAAADLTDDTLFAVDVDARKLARLVRARVPVRPVGLAEPAEQLYDVVLDESCMTLVQVVKHLPAFEPRALAELEQFGIDVRRYKPRTLVSVAYLSLQVSADPGRRGRGDRPDERWFTEGRRTIPAGGSSLRAEAALAESERTLLRGDAGSGKTTLLQWLAVTAARSGFSGPLAGWNGCVPFLVRLRSYADRPLPRPEQLLAGVADPLVDLLPPGWVHRQLSSGRALLLVDGVDELVPAQRPAVRRWLRSLLAEYPQVRVVVTSRPGAADRGWLAGESFAPVLLEKMSPLDVAAFCRRWHDAMRDAAQRRAVELPCPVEELADYERALLRSLDGRLDLRGLASSPLLCAMLCALNLDRRKQLPPDRMALYWDALALLLERRDAEREVPASRAVVLDAASKLAILQHVAWRLSLDGRAELPRDEVLELVRRVVARMPNADEWNRRWPDELKTFKSFSSWEQWPSSTGHAPSFDNFGKLAELYECAVSDLLSDLPDFRHRDTGAGAPATTLTMPKPDAELVVPSDVAVWATATGPPLPDTFVTALMQHLGSLALSGRDVLSTPRDRDRAYHQLVRFLRSWAHIMDRRDMLGLLSWAATTASLLASVDGDEHQRVASVLTTSSRVDAQTIEHIEAVLWHCRRQDHALGPQAALNTVLAQRDLARALVPDCPDVLRPRMLSALSEASRQAGWLSFDLKQFDHATYYYEDARALAHEAENTGLGGLVLCNMSLLATWQGTPRIGIDHAVAAGQWAYRTEDMRLRAYTADVAARAYAADGQRDACLTALDTAHTVLTTADHQAPSHTGHDEASHVAIRGNCHPKLGETDRAICYAQQSLKVLDRSLARTVAMTIVDLGEAYVQCNEIDEAARLLGDAGDITASHSSARLTGRLTQARADLQPWQHTAAVRTLDDRLASYGLA